MALGASAGCLESRSPFAPPMVEDRPDAVYVPSHFEEMAPIGDAQSGPLSAVLRYSYPHRFWLITGTDRKRVQIESKHAIHLMAAVWDRESGRVIYGLNPRIEVTTGGAVVDERFLWPMISQPMGFHYGDNLPLDGDGRYSITLTVPPTGLETDSAFDGRLDRTATFEFEFDWDRSNLEDLEVNTVEEPRKGRSGALSPMSMGPEPSSTAPETLPGTALGTAVTDEISLRASLLEHAQPSPTVYIVASTPHNGYSLSDIGMRASVDDSTEPIPIRQAISPAEGIHYRLRHPSLSSGETLRVEVLTQPQIARHEGYETAFTDPQAVEFSLP